MNILSGAQIVTDDALNNQKSFHKVNIIVNYFFWMMEKLAITE